VAIFSLIQGFASSESFPSFVIYFKINHMFLDFEEKKREEEDEGKQNE
jgi:hypothetical protein